jgi:hypothetical protein
MRARSCDIGSMAQTWWGAALHGARVKRLRRMLEGEHRRWNQFNLEVLRAHAAAWRKRGGLCSRRSAAHKQRDRHRARLQAMRRSGVYR